MGRLTASDVQELCRGVGIPHVTPEKAAKAIRALVESGFMVPVGQDEYLPGPWVKFDGHPGISRRDRKKREAARARKKAGR